MASRKYTILESAAQTASGNSASDACKIPTLTHLVVVLDITAGSGTITDFDFWMEHSVDDGLTWTPMPMKALVVNSTRAVTQAPTTADLVTNKATTTAERYSAHYENVAAGRLRARWTLTGTNPSLTFSVKAEGK